MAFEAMGRPFESDRAYEIPRQAADGGALATAGVGAVQEVRLLAPPPLSLALDRLPGDFGHVGRGTERAAVRLG
jgi:hypothetical protein